MKKNLAVICLFALGAFVWAEDFYYVYGDVVYRYTGAASTLDAVVSDVSAGGASRGTDVTEALSNGTIFAGNTIPADSVMIVLSGETLSLSSYVNRGTIYNLGTVYTYGTQFTNQGSFINKGNAGFTNGILNSAGAVLDNQATADIYTNFSNLGTIKNSGTFTAHNNLDNQGSVENRGTFAVADNLLNTGSITNSGGGSVTGGTISGNAIGETGILYWVGPAGGDWSNAQNWASSSGGSGGAGVPDADTTVWINQTGSSVRLSSDVTVYTLYVQNGVTLNLNGNNLSVSSGGNYSYAAKDSEYFRGAIHVGRNGTGGSLNLTGAGKLSCEILDQEEMASNTINLGASSELIVTGHMWCDSLETTSTRVNGSGTFTFASGSHIVLGATPEFGLKIASTVTVNDPDGLLVCRWTGAVSSVWSNNANWNSRHVPQDGDDVIIPATASNPEISADSTASSTLGNLRVETGAELRFSKDLSVTGYEGNGAVISMNSKRFTVSANADVTVREFGVLGGTSANIYNGSADPSVVLTVLSYMTVSDISLNTYGNVSIRNGINAAEITANGTLTVEGSATASGNITSNLGSAIVFAGSGRSLNCGGNLRIYGSITAPETVVLTGANPVVTGNVDFNSLNVSACTSVTFEGDISASGNVTGPSGNMIFLGDADFSGAGVFAVTGDIWFYNLNSLVTKTFSTKADSAFRGFYFWGNTEVVVNGNCSAVNFQMNSKGPFVNYTFTSLVSKGSGAGTITVTGTGAGNGILTSRSSSTANVKGTLRFACDADASSSVIETHSGTVLLIDEGFTVQTGRLFHSASGYEIKTQIDVNGTLEVSGDIDIAASVGAAEFNVGTTGSVSASSVKSTAAAYNNTGSTVPFTNDGNVSVSFGFNLSRLNIVNNGTITLKDGAYFSALTVRNSAGDTSKGQIKVLKDTGDGSQTALLTSASAAQSSYQNLISAEGLSVTLAGKWVTSDFEAASGMGGKSVTLNGSTVTAENLALSGASGNPLSLSASAAGDGFILSSSLTGGDWLSIDDKIIVKDASGKTAAFTYTAENSVPAAGTLDTDYAAVIINGWEIRDRALFTYTWTGGSTTGTAASGTTVRTDWSNPLNWNIKLVPVNNCTVVIPDGLTYYPVIPSQTGTVTEWKAGNLTVGSGAGTAKITLNNADLVLSGMAGNTAASETISNSGTIVYTNAGRITDGADVINDVTQGTVEYAAGTVYSGVVSETGAVDYYNLKISGNTWEIPEDIKVSETWTVSGGTFKGIAEAGSVRITGTATANGDFGFVSDDISVNARINAANYVATVKPASNSIPVVFGVAEAGSLCLTNTELTNLAAKTVIFGDENNTAGLKVNASLTVRSGIHLITGGALTQSTAGSYTINSVAGELYLQAATGIGDISGSAPVTVGSVGDTVSAKITGAGDIYIKISNAATLGGEGSKIILTPNGNIQIETTGVMTLGGDITSSAGTLGLISGGAIIHNAGTLNSSSTIKLEAAGAIGSALNPVQVKHTPDGGNLIAQTSSSTQGVFVTEEGTMTVSSAGDISVNGGTGAVLLKAEQFDFVSGAVGAGTGTVTVSSFADDGSIVIDQALIDGINTTKERDFVAGGTNHTGEIDVNGNVDVSVFKNTLLQTGKINSTGGDFTGSVSVVPSGASLEFSGDIAFDTLTASTLGGKTFYFENSTTFTVKSGLTLTGTSEISRLALRSDSEGSQWNIECLCGESNVLIQYVDVEDSYNNSSFDLEARMPSKDSGNNDNWSFPGQLYTWTGMSLTTPNKWKDKANWSPASVPGRGGNVRIPDVSSGSGEYPVLDENISLGTGTLTIDGASVSGRALFDLASFNFTAKSVTNNGILRMAGGNRITVNGIDASTGSAGAAIVNGTLSLVEYYGALGTSLPWGKTYRNLSFIYDAAASSGASVSLPAAYALNVTGKTIIASGSGNDVSLPALNTFAGGVVIGDEGSGVTAGHVVLNASSLTIESGAVCDSLTVKCNATTGGVKTSAQIPGTSDAETQVYEGNVILASSGAAAAAEFAGNAGDLIHFKGTVDGIAVTPVQLSDLIITDSDVQFDGNAGEGSRLGTLTAGGNAVINCNRIVTRKENAVSQSYAGSVTVCKDIRFEGNNGTVEFQSALKGNSSTAGEGRSVTLTGFNVVFEEDVGDSAGLLGSLSVSGTADFTKASDQTVSTEGTQTYTKNVSYTSPLILSASGVIFGTADGIAASVSGAGDLTVNAPVTAAGSSHTFDLSDSASSVFYKAFFNNGFTSGAFVKVKGNAYISGDNVFNLLQIDNSSFAAAGGTTVTFDGDSVQTIKNSPLSLDFAGFSESSPLLITGGDSDHNWTVVFTSDITKESFSFVKVENSKSLTATGSGHRLNIIPSVAAVQDTDNTDFTTTNWFSYDYFWTGGTDTQWTTGSNWSYSEDGSIPALGYPSFSNGLTVVKVVDDKTVLTLGPDTGNIKVEEISVYSGKTVDFDSYDITLTGSGPQIINRGTIRLAGSQAVTADGESLSVSEETDSTVEYYGACGSALPLGYSYYNLSFVYDSVRGTGGSLSLGTGHNLSIGGKALFASNYGNDVAVGSDIVFGSAVILGDADSSVPAGSVSLTGANVWGGNLTINDAENVVVNGNAAGVTVSDGALCHALNIKCASKLASVITSRLLALSSEATQHYEGAVTLTDNAVFTGAAGHKIVFDRNVSQISEGSASFKAAGSDVDFNGSVNVSDISAAANVIFGGNVTSGAEISVAGDTGFTAAGVQSVSSSGNQTYSGPCFVNSTLTLSASDGDDATDETVEFNGISYGSGSLSVNSTIAVLNSGDYITDGNQRFNCPKGVRVTKSQNGKWMAGSSISLVNSTDLYLDFGTQALTLMTNLSAANIWFWSGDLTVNGGVTVNTENAAVWGSVAGTPAYSADDPRYAGPDTRFAYYGADSLIYQSAAGTGALLSAGAGSKPVFNISGNLYVNGTDISGFKFNLPDSDSSNPVFNEGASVTEKQWGLPYAVVFNSTITDVEVGCLSASGHAWITAGETDNDTGSSVVTQGCVDGGSNSGVQFKVPHIDEAYSVYDDVIYVHFDMLLENSNDEIRTNLALASNGAVEKGGVWYSSGAYEISGAYTDKECTSPVTQSSGDIQEFYLRAKLKADGSYETWNTDADALRPSADSSLITTVNDSTDRAGVHKNVTTDLSMLEGLFTAASGHTMSRNYGAGKEDVTPALSYKETKDKTSPVLIAVYTGQELHEQYVQSGGASSQKEYDAHNFIEFRYSEAVNIGDLSYDGDSINIRAEETFASAASHGGHIAASGDTLTVQGFGSMNGRLNAQVRPDCADGSPHALYRHFSTKAGAASENQSHRVRISVAGFVDGTVTYTDSDYSGESGVFHKWAGFINSAETPSGTVARIGNEYISDIDDNKLSSSETENHPLPVLTVNGYADGALSPAVSLYGNWDTIAPVVAPFSTTFESWSEWYSTGTSEISEIIGSTTGSFLDHVELHLFDNGRTTPALWPGQWWRTKLGWNGLTASPSLPDTAGGARPFTENGASTQGGIRRSSLDGANSSFTYKAIIDGSESPEAAFAPAAVAGIRQRVNGSIFRNSSDPDTTNDSLFISLPLSASENLAVRTTFIVSYDPSSDYITDLAGNRLASTYSAKADFNSIDFTPPAYTMTLSPIAENKIYVIFTKRLAYDDHTYLDELSPAQRELAMEDIKDSFIVCSAKTSSSQIGITKAEFVSFSKEYTALLLTLERSVTLDDVEKLWLRNTGINGGTVTVVDVSGFTIADTKIRDDAGNYLAQNKAHALSDFAVNAVEVLYAFGHQKDDDGWDEQGIYGETRNPDAENYAVHDFTRTQGNYGRLVSGRDITLQVRTIAGKDASGDFIAPAESFLLMPSFKASLTPAMVSDKINSLLKADWRLWLPTSLSSLASAPNTNVFASPASPVNADEGAGLLWNYVFPDEDYHFKGGDEIQFVFKVQKDGSDVLIDHDADNDPVIGSASPTDEVPLYAVSMPLNRINAGDFSFIDLWGFGIKDQKHQRGGVSIFNNVINVNRREQTVVEVKMKEEGNLNIYVMTADGSIVKRLAHGRTNAGTHYYKWNGTNNSGNGVARGIYFIRVSGPGIDETRKVLCVKDN